VVERDAEPARARRDEACVASKVARQESNRSRAWSSESWCPVELAERADGEAESREAACRAAAAQIRVSQARIDLRARAPPRAHAAARPLWGTVAEIKWRDRRVRHAVSGRHPDAGPAVDVVDTTASTHAPIDEVDAPPGPEGMTARVTLDAFKDPVFRALLRRVALRARHEKQARTVEVEAEIDDRGDALLLPATAPTSR